MRTQSQSGRIAPKADRTGTHSLRMTILAEHVTTCTHAFLRSPPFSKEVRLGPRSEPRPTAQFDKHNNMLSYRYVAAPMKYPYPHGSGDRDRVAMPQ